MRIVLLAYIFLTFLAPENEGLRDDCPQCVDNSANRFLASATSNSNQFQFQRTSNRALPQYRPIIAAYHPRVSNRQQFFSRNADHLLDEIEAPVQPHQAQPHSYVRVPIRSKVATMTPLTSTVATTPSTTSSTTTTTTTTTTTSTTTTTTTTARPEPELESYEDVPVSSTSRPNYRPRPVSIRTPFAGRNPKQNVFNRTPSTPRTTTPNSWNEVTKVSPVINAIAEDDNSDNKAEFEPKRREERRGRQRKRFRSTTTSTTTLEPPLEDDDDYYDYDQEYDDYDYPATTTTTTTTQRPRGRERGRGGRGRGGRGRPYRRGGRRRPRPTEPTTTTTTTTLSPNYKARPDGRIIDYNADPNFPYELKGADLTDYPFYISIPENDFKCKGRHDGYYANIELSCQVYHHCASGHQRYDFLCPNYTLFDQTTFTCRFINTVDCATSENHYVRNNELYVTTPNPNSDYVRPPLRQFYPNDGDKSRTSEATGKLQSSASEMQQAAVEFALRNGAKLETTNQGDTKERIRTL